MKVIDKVPVDFANWAADEFISYFQNFHTIEDYLRYAKKEEAIVHLDQIFLKIYL